MSAIDVDGRTCFEGRDGYSLVDTSWLEFMRCQVRRLQDERSAMTARADQLEAELLMRRRGEVVCVRLERELSEAKATIEDYRRDSACYETAFDEAESMVKENVQRQMGELRANLSNPCCPRCGPYVPGRARR